MRNKDRPFYKSEFFLMGMAMLVAFAAYLLTAGKIADHDAFVMGETAQLLASGKALYIDAWDNKPPLTLLFYFPSQWLAPHSYLVQQLFTFLWTALQAMAVFWLLKGEKSWIRITIATLILWMPLTWTDFAWGSSEDVVNGFTIILTVIGYRIMRDGKIRPALWLIAGLALGAAFHARQPGIFFMGLPLAALFISPQPWNEKFQSLAMSAIGCMIAFAAIIGIMLLISDWSSYVDIMFNKPAQYGGIKPNMATAAAVEGIAAPAVNTPNVVMRFLQLLIDKSHVIRSVLIEHFSLLGMNLLLVVPLLAIFICQGRWRIFALLAVGIGMASVLLPMKLFSHYHQQLIPVFAIAALLILRRIDSLSLPVARGLAIGLLSVILLKVVLTAETLRNDNGEMAEMNRIVEMIEEKSSAQDRLFAVGRNSAYIYYRSSLEFVHKIHWDKFFGWLSIYLPVNVETVMDEIIEKPPDWIIIDQESHDRIRFLSKNIPENDARIARLLQQLNSEYIYQEVYRSGRWIAVRYQDEY